MDEVMIDIKNAGIDFNDFALENVNLQIPKGYIVEITGANGAGKTVLIKMMLGLYPKMKGVISTGGYDVVKQRDKMLGITGYVSEDREFFMEYSAIENENMYKSFYPKWNSEKYRNALKSMKVPVNTKLKDLSKGNYIKFQAAFALAVSPKLLILDEPTAGLDPVFRADFLKMLQTLIADENMTVVMSTNIADDLEKVADYIVEIKNGVCCMRENQR